MQQLRISYIATEQCGRNNGGTVRKAFLIIVSGGYIRTWTKIVKMWTTKREPSVRGFNWAALFLGIWMWGPAPPGRVSLTWDSNIWLRVLHDSIGPDRLYNCLVQNTLLSSDAGDFLPMIQYKYFTFRSIFSFFFFLAKCCAHVSLESKCRPRYFTGGDCGVTVLFMCTAGQVSNETVIYGYGSFATLISEWYALQNTDPSSRQRGRSTWRRKYMSD
jgi:hypothetical protein